MYKSEHVRLENTSNKSIVKKKFVCYNSLQLINLLISSYFLLFSFQYFLQARPGLLSGACAVL